MTAAVGTMRVAVLVDACIEVVRDRINRTPAHIDLPCHNRAVGKRVIWSFDSEEAALRWWHEVNAWLRSEQGQTTSGGESPTQTGSPASAPSAAKHARRRASSSRRSSTARTPASSTSPNAHALRLLQSEKL